jgi:hypothetical protein
LGPTKRKVIKRVTVKQIQEFRWLYLLKLEFAVDTVLSALLKPIHYDLVSRV